MNLGRFHTARFERARLHSVRRNLPQLKIARALYQGTTSVVAQTAHKIGVGFSP
jgi:hypothetical protein